jgi:hypothetical protein
MRTFAQILQDAERIIEKRAHEAEPPPVPAIEEDEIFKLASQVRTCQSELPPPFEFTETEKVAHAMAILETLFSAKDLTNLVKFEKEARARGMSDETIQGFFNKVADQSQTGRRVFDFMHGAGEGLESYIKSLPNVDPTSWRGVGQMAGAAAPLVAVGTAGGMYGAHRKEEEIKKKYGVG